MQCHKRSGSLNQCETALVNVQTLGSVKAKIIREVNNIYSKKASREHAAFADSASSVGKPVSETGLNSILQFGK